jgi:D-alanyl-D-alanine carboxypeptidase (penicillin-binding protein 5/6)
LAILGSYALRNEAFSSIVKIPEETIYAVDGRFAHELTNSNRLVRPSENLYSPYAIGVKTGFTYEAGHVLVSAAEKDGHRILSVVLNTYKNTKPASAEESKKLLEWGLNNWTWANR